MNVIAYDSETGLIKPGMMAPRLVCGSWASRSDENIISSLDLRENALCHLKNYLIRSTPIVIHNASFDLGVVCAEDPAFLPLVFDAYRDGRIRCTIVRQKLIDVALGMRKWRRHDGRVSRASYSLADLIALYYGGEHVEKEDTWRLRYSLLDGVPLNEWPEDAKKYAIDDAVLHLRLYEAQEREIVELFGELPNQVEQQRAAWALHLMSMWGFRADPKAVEKFEDQCRVAIYEMEERLALDCQHCGQRKDDHDDTKCKERAWSDTGIFKRHKKTGEILRTPSGAPQRTMKEIMRRVAEGCARVGVQVPMTDPSPTYPEGQIQTDKDALLLTDDPALHVLAESMTYAKHLGQWGPVLRAAIDRAVCCRYEVLVETGRTSCSGSEGQEGTNNQNPPRKGDVRPAIVARAGHVFGFADADTIELRAHAQNCLEMVGWSRMAEALVEQAQSKGPDLHEILAAALVDWSPKKLQEGIVSGIAEAIDARQFAKIPNFGFPGGLGAPTFVAYAAGQLSRADYLKWFDANREEAIKKARAHREAWFESWPENRVYFKKVGTLIGDEGEGTIRQLMSGRIRGGVRFTAAANGFFQGRVADAMKEALFQLANECYTGRCTSKHQHGGSRRCTHEGRSVLYQSRPNMFLHDESVVEIPEDGNESDAVERQAEINVEALSRWMPDIPCTSSGVLTRRWHKGAKQIRVDGRIVPVRPELDGKKVRWVHDQAAR